MVDSINPETLLDEREVANRLGVSIACLRKWRGDQTGPAYFKLGVRVRYARADIEEWIASRRVAPKAA